MLFLLITCKNFYDYEQAKTLMRPQKRQWDGKIIIMALTIEIYLGTCMSTKPKARRLWAKGLNFKLELVLYFSALVIKFFDSDARFSKLHLLLQCYTLLPIKYTHLVT